MGLLAAALSDRGPFADSWYEPGGSRYGGANRLEGDNALHIPAVYACTVAIAEDIAKNPLGIFEDLGAKGRRPAPEHPVDQIMHHPNHYQSPLEFKEMLTAFAVLRGKGVAEIRPGTRRQDTELIPLHPDLVREERSRSTGMPRWQYLDPLNNYEERVILPEDTFVIRGRFGKGILDYALESLGLELSMERYSLFMFTRGSKHQGVITHPKVLPGPSRTALRRALDDYGIDGPRAGRPLLLEDGMTWHDVSLANRDMEFLAQRKFGIEQICRWFRVPPHKIAELQRSTNNNINQQSIDYVVDALLGWAVRWEQAIPRDLLSPAEFGRFYAKINLNGQLRGDFKARADAYALAIQWGWLTRNEVRELEDYNPVAGGDDISLPLNMAPGSKGPGGAASAEVRGQLRLLASDAASRVVRREVAAVNKAAERSAGDQATFRAALEALYDEHVAHVASTLHVPEHVARQYAQEQRNAILADGPTVMADWLTDRVGHLTTLAMDQPEVEAAA